MKISKVKPDNNNVQWVIPNVAEDNILNILTFDCDERKEELDDIVWYVFNPKTKKKNFFTGITGALVFDQKVYDSELFTLFETAGEILPIKLETGESLYILNVLECVNMLNQKETEFDIYESGERGRILKYVFYPDRITESSIFKIPETSKVDVLTYTGIHDADDEFYYLYKKLGFTGLKFDLLFES